MTDHIVFVYGTLRRGEGNSYLLKGSKFIGPAVTAGRGYSMTRHGTIPFVADGGNCQVLGELWSVNDETFARLDRLESHPRLYRRRRRWFWTQHPAKSGQTRYRGWVYVVNRGWGAAPLVNPDKWGRLRCPTRLELQASGEF